MTGKRKNLIRLSMKAPVSVFDPENKGSDIEENRGILGDIRGKQLVQISKKQLIANQEDASWKNKPKAKTVKLTSIAK